MDPELPVGQELRALRRHRMLRAVLETADGSRYEIVIRNFSKRGMGGLCRDARLQTGANVKVLLPDDRYLAGKLRWRTDHGFGLELDTELDEEALAESIRHLTKTKQNHSDWKVGARHRVSTPEIDPTKIRRI